jgi:hypothetical protein
LGTTKEKKRLKIIYILKIRKTQYKQQNPIENPHLEKQTEKSHNPKSKSYIIKKKNPSPIEIFYLSKSENETLA